MITTCDRCGQPAFTRESGAPCIRHFESKWGSYGDGCHGTMYATKDLEGVIAVTIPILEIHVISEIAGATRNVKVRAPASGVGILTNALDILEEQEGVPIFPWGPASSRLVVLFGLRIVAEIYWSDTRATPAGPVTEEFRWRFYAGSFG